MGLLNFLNRRPSADAALENPFTRQVHPSPVPALPTSRGTLSAHGNRPSTLEGLQQSASAWKNFRGITVTEISAGGPTPSVKPRLVGISEGQPVSGPYDEEPENQEQRPKSSGRNLRDAQRSLSVASASTTDGKGRMHRDRVPAPLLAPLTTQLPPDYPASPMRRQSSAFVDILDAQGEIKSCSFKSRVKASGSRDYGEDVADRNMVENGANSPRVSAFSSSTGMFSPIRPRGSPSVASSFRSLHRAESILEESASPLEDSDVRSLPSRSAMKEGQFARKSSVAVSMLSSSSDMVPNSPVDSVKEDSRFGHRRGKKSLGRASVLSCRTATPVQSLNMICDANSVGAGSQCASPRDLQFKQRQYSLPGDQLQGRTKKGSVRAAREALQTSGYARERLFLKEGVPALLPHQRQENYHDWSRFNKSALGEHLRPSSRTFDDACSAHSESPRTPFFASAYSVRSRLDNAAGWTPTRQGSIASSAPPTCDRSSPRYTGARSIHSADTSSIDMTHSSLFEEMKYGASSRSLRSQGGDSCIAPDCVGPDEDSCGDSVFISPATPVNGEADLSPRNRAAFEAASIYDSDTESFREKRRLLRPDAEAQLKAKGFVSQGKPESEIFDEAKSRSLSTSKWAEMLVTPTDASDLGDDEESVADGLSRGQRKNSARPFTQRERMLALGYDYDSDSDVEASVDSDEIPEERALQLLTALMEAGGSTSGRQGEQKVNMNTIAKLRKEIRKRRRTCAAGRRPSRAPINTQLDDESNEN